MRATTFLAAQNGQGADLAELGPEGEWQRRTVLGRHRVVCLARDPHDARVVLAGTDDYGLMRSMDRGITWEPAGLEGETVKAVSVSPASPGLIFAGTRPALMHISRDNGASWSELASFRDIPGRWFWFSPAESPWKAYVQSIAPSPTDPDVLVVGVEFGATVRSSDGGRSWSRHLDGSLRDCHSVRFHSSDGQWAYEAGGTGGGVSFSRDGGETWTQRKQGLDRTYGWACAADPEKPEIWYASLAPGPGKAHVDGQAEAFIYRAEGGAPWIKLSGGLPQPMTSMPYELHTDPASPGHLYAGLGDGQIWHTADYGDSWEHVPVMLRGIHRSMVMWIGEGA